MEIVLLLGFTDVIFRRERNDDRKYICASQARAEGVAPIKSDSGFVFLHAILSLTVLQIKINFLKK